MPVSAEQIAEIVGANPSYIIRLIGGLKEHEYII